jgi:1-acyl-sn-glycerol-3-phosphate acyltransferase
MARASHSASSAERRWITRAFQAVNVLYVRLFHELSVASPHSLPRSGPAIIVSNHTSSLDPLLIQSLCPRLIVWMVASEYCELPALRWMFNLIQAIPVDRSGRDVAATRQALRALSAGRLLGVFPEGRLEPDGELLPFQTGVALMAIKTRVPIYPVHLDGTQRRQSIFGALLHQNRSRIAFGPPLRLYENFSAKDLSGATLATQSAVRELAKDAHGMPSGGLDQQKKRRNSRSQVNLATVFQR